MAQECLPFAARFRDLYERFRLEQSIRDLVWLLERGGYRNGQSATAQMHALPLLPGWPQGRYFEVLDAQGGVTARYPAAGPFEAAQALRLSEQAVGEGRVFDVLLSGLDTQQKVGLLGEGVSANEEHAALARQLLAQLKADRRPLFEQLYQAYDGPVPEEWAPLRQACRVGLAKILQLPGQPKHMRYGSLADLTSENLERAHEQVLIAELSPVFLRFIAQLSFWKAHLKQQFPETFRRAAEPFDSQQQALFENSQNLTDGEYLAQMEGLRAPRRQAINEVMERLTQQMMKYQDLDICHLPED